MSSIIRMLHLAPSFSATQIEQGVLTTAFDDGVVTPYEDDVSSLLHALIEADVLVTLGTEIGPEIRDAVKSSVIAIYATGVD